MISAEKARQNVNKYKSDLEHKKPKLVAEFLAKIAEPNIIEASKNGSNLNSLYCGSKYTCVRAEIIDALQAEGFKVICLAESNLIHVSWG